jgi:hypothetical protein
VSAGIKPRQAVVIHDYCTNVDPVLGQILQMVEDPERSRRVGEHTKHLIKKFLHSKSVYSTTNEARSFHLTIFKAMVPPHPKENDSRRTHELFRKKMKEFSEEFDLTPLMKKAALVSSIHRRDYELNPERNLPVMEHYKRRSPYNIKVTLDLKNQFIDWCINLSDTVICSPDKKDVMIARDLETGEKIKDTTESPKEWVYQRKYKYKGSLNRLYQEAIQPPEQGGFPGFRDKNGEVWIGRSSFEKCIPGYFGRLTESHKRGCECISCLNGEYMMADYVNWQKFSRRHQEKLIGELEDWIKENPKHEHLQKKRRELGEAKRELQTFLKDVFKEYLPGRFSPEPKYTKLEDLVNNEMCCGLIDGTKLCPYKCGLQRCEGKCQTFPRNHGEHHKARPRDKDAKKNSHWMITWRFHESVYHCRIHNAFKNGTKGKESVCPWCETLTKKEQPTQKPKKTEDPVKKTKPIYEFITEFEEFINTKWRLHNWQKIGLNGKCKEFRKAEKILSLRKHQRDVFLIRDYTDRIKCAYDRSTMAGEMGGAQKNIGEEGFLYALYNHGTGKVEWNWMGYLSDEKQQDARTSFVNTRKFVEMMQRQKYLPEGATLWVQSDGCGKQYKSGTTVETYSLIAQIYKIQVDYFITTAGHGKCLVDSLSGTDKAHLGNGFLSGIDPARTLGDSKHKRREGGTYIHSRNYDVSNYTAENDIPLKNCCFVVTGFEAGNKNGIKEHFHFRYHYKLNRGEVFIRRVACII